MIALLQLAILLAASPAVLGVIVRVKSLVAGRRGPPLLQPYHDLARLFRKQVVVSATGTWITAAAAPTLFAAVIVAFLIVPIAGREAPLAFPGDFALFVALLALARLAVVLLALDTGSSFEGMGASREAWLGAMAEPAMLLALGALAVLSGETSLSAFVGAQPAHASGELVTRALVGLALGIVLLAETARIPVDDPATHLELTMIHEVMLLDASGPDLALCEWAHAIKLFGLSMLIAQVVMPWGADPAARALSIAGGGLVVALGIGAIESVTARLALSRVPQLLIGAGVLGGVAIGAALGMRG